MAFRKNPDSAAPFLRTCNSATESTPPESPMARRLPRRSIEPRNRPTSAMTSPLGRFLELAIGHYALEALLDQLFGLFLLHLLERLGERLAQRLSRPRRSR